MCSLKTSLKMLQMSTYAGLQIRVCNGKLFFLFLNQNIVVHTQKNSKHMFKLMEKKIIIILTFFILDNSEQVLKWQSVKTQMKCSISSGSALFVKINTSFRNRWESSGSVVECLTRDRGPAGSSLTGITASCP